MAQKRSMLKRFIVWRLRSQIKRRRIITCLRFVKKKKKKEKASFYSTKISSNNTFDLLWKIHWNTKTCITEEISIVVYMPWTNEFNLYKNGDHRRSCAKVKLFDGIETNPGPLINDIDPTLTVKRVWMGGGGDVSCQLKFWPFVSCQLIGC